MKTTLILLLCPLLLWGQVDSSEAHLVDRLHKSLTILKYGRDNGTMPDAVVNSYIHKSPFDPPIFTRKIADKVIELYVVHLLFIKGCDTIPIEKVLGSEQDYIKYFAFEPRVVALETDRRKGEGYWINVFDETLEDAHSKYPNRHIPEKETERLAAKSCFQTFEEAKIFGVNFVKKLKFRGGKIRKD